MINCINNNSNDDILYINKNVDIGNYGVVVGEGCWSIGGVVVAEWKSGGGGEEWRSGGMVERWCGGVVKWRGEGVVKWRGGGVG